LKNKGSGSGHEAGSRSHKSSPSLKGVMGEIHGDVLSVAIERGNRARRYHHLNKKKLQYLLFVCPWRDLAL
jgi:hypothetical protein